MRVHPCFKRGLLGRARTASGGGAERGQKERKEKGKGKEKEKDEIRAVLERMWTEVIVRLSPALELQVA